VQRCLCSAADVALRGRRSSVLARPTRKTRCAEREGDGESNDAVLVDAPTATRATAARHSSQTQNLGGAVKSRDKEQLLALSGQRRMSAEASGGRQPPPPTTTTTVNVADLDIAQLADVKRQLDQASPIRLRPLVQDLTDKSFAGTRASYEFICSAETGPSQVQRLCGKYYANRTSKHKCVPRPHRLCHSLLTSSTFHRQYCPCPTNDIPLRSREPLRSRTRYC
jgi:hypothetical protein